MKRRFLSVPARCRLLCALFTVGLALPLFPARPADGDADALPPNLGHSLRQLVAWHRAQPANLSAVERRARLTRSLPARARHLQTNADATRAVVDVTLNGTMPLAAVRGDLAGLGAEVFAQYDARHAGSVLSARLPLDQAVAAARLPGVHSISLVHRAWRHVGKATSQGAKILRTAQVNRLGFDGTGITVGVISDSFNAGKDDVGNPFTTSAYQDVLNGDLPGAGNPFGHLQGVLDLKDAASTDDVHNDEGRAMCQIIHDLAPGAQLVFHAAGTTPETLVAAIADLRSLTPDGDYYGGANCDVIVDDLGFPDEPMFSDGAAALEAGEVATSLVLPGKPAVYVSSAGNAGDVGYEAEFTPISDADARAGTGAGNLKLDQVPTQLTAGGFHNFNPRAGKVTVGQKFKLHGDTEISFQWDDPFLPGAVTTDYNLLVFDADGTYLPDLSGTDDNIALGKAVEVLDLSSGDGVSSVTYQFAIARTAGGTGAARHLRYVVNGGSATIKFTNYNRATTFGHNAGPDVIGVAAYAYDRLTEPEPYSSLGPATIYFDAQGNRLATPEVRQQPAVAAVDGIDTSFFPPGPLTYEGKPNTDTDGNGLPNFFGTSAASPHVAAVAALLLQAAGGPGSLTPAQVLTLLQSTAAAHDLDPNSTSAALTLASGAKVTLTATADETNAASEDKNGFQLTFDGPSGQFLSKVIIDLAITGLKYDPSTGDGFPFTVGTKVGLKPTDVTGTLDAGNTTLTLKFAPGAFTTGRSLNFGVDRDLVSNSDDGNSADLLNGASVKVRASGGDKAQGALASRVGAGYSPAVGFGLVDALAALRSLQTDPPVKTRPVPASGDILLTNADNEIVEVRPDGTQAQKFPTLPDPTNGTVDPVYEHVSESLIDANGRLVVLYNAFTLYLVTLDLKTGATTTVTAPDWSSGGSSSSGGIPDEIVATGPYVFSTYHERGYPSTHGSLLRFDSAGNAPQPFGRQFTDGSYAAYRSLAVGPDGLLYALLDDNYSALSSVDVYDPNTLACVGNIALNFHDVNSGSSFASIDKIAVGPAGEFYALSTDSYNDRNVYKFDAAGQQIASLALPSDAKDVNVQNLRANAQGEIVVGSLDPILIDPTFTTAALLREFGVNDYTYSPSVTAAFVP